MAEKTRKYKIKSLSTAQNEWLKSYQSTTGFEPMHLDEIESGEMSFNEAANSNIDWYEAHMHDAFNSISTHVPFDEPSHLEVKTIDV